MFIVSKYNYIYKVLKELKVTKCVTVTKSNKYLTQRQAKLVKEKEQIGARKHP